MKAYSKAISGVVAAMLLIALPLFGGCAAADAVRTDSGIESWSALQDVINSAASGDTIVLSGDLTAGEADSELIIPAGKCLTLDLNGHTLNRNMNEDDPKDNAIYVSAGAILTVRDSGASQGAITGGRANNGGGISNHGTLILEGGRIAGNNARHSGGGIANYGTAILMGGSVTGNTALREGGGVYNGAKARLTVNDGVLFGNIAPKDGDIFNEGALSLLGARPDDARVEEIPVLRAYMTELSVLPAAALLLVLVLAVWLDAYLSRERKRAMAVIIALVFSLMLQNYAEYRLSLVSGASTLRIPSSIFGYAVRPAILAMFLYIVKPGGRYGFAWVLIGVNAAVYLTAFFSPIAFSFNKNGHFISGPLNYTCTFVSAALFAWLFLLTIRQFRPSARKESWIPIFVAALLAGAVVMDYTVVFDEQPLAFLTIAIVVSCVAYYVWLHLQFVREHEEALRAGQRIQLMMSQIQPHFLFNTLSTIQALCVKDPKTAVYAIEQFGVYLRKNLEALTQTKLIPLPKELEHTRAYAEIEALRFDNIHVDYDLREQGFRVPALSIQPLVENAIRHGVRARKDGRVIVITRREGDENRIVIRDNGTGFDASAVRDSDGAHIGIANVRSRIEQMCGGTLEIDSRIGEGTTVTIRIPVARK